MLLTLLKIKLKSKRRNKTDDQRGEITSPRSHQDAELSQSSDLSWWSLTAPLGLLLGMGRRPCGQGDPTHAEDWVFSLSDVAEV